MLERVPAPASAGLPSLHTTRSGARVLLRELRPTDLELLGGFIDTLSASARRQRFHGAVNTLPQRLLQAMTRFDPQHELALLALSVDSGRCIGEARYMRGDAPEAREFALVLADAWQGQGLGRRLLCTLQNHARRQGVERLVGELMRDNLAMIGLARHHGYELRRHPGDPRLLRASLALRPAAALAPRAAHGHAAPDHALAAR